MERLYALAKVTFLETIRQPIFNLLLWIAIFWVTVVAPATATYTLLMGDDIKMLKDVGLATLMLYGLLAAVFSATGVVTREIESHTVLTVLSKPITRTTFLLGKYLGVIAAIGMGYLIVSICFLMAVRHGVLETAADNFDPVVLTFGLLALFGSLAIAGVGNYLYGWDFQTALNACLVPGGLVAFTLVLFLDHEWQLQSPLTDFGGDGAIVVIGVIMMLFAVVILTAFAVAFSTRFSQPITLMLSLAVLGVGLLSNYYFLGSADQSLLARLLWYITPNFQFFWVGDQIVLELAVPASLVAMTAGYALAYTAAVFAVAVMLFQTREVG